MKFDLNNLNPGIKFFFDENKTEEGSVTFRACTGQVLDEINESTSERKVDYFGGQRFDYMHVSPENRTKRQEKIWDYCIVSWDVMLDANGEEIPCTAENKFFLMKNSLEFASFYSEKMEVVNKTLKERTMASEKN